MLEFKNVIKKYDGKEALSDFNAVFEEGHIYALVGPNGSGKSTMMKVAAGLVKPNYGKCTFNGAEIGTKSKAHIAYMSTEAFFYDYMKIKDVGNYYADFFEDFRKDKFSDLLKFMELDEKKKVKALSSGMLAKMKVAVTLARDASLIMLDEPLNGIDLLGRDRIIDAIITAASENSAFIVSSHLFDELESVADSVVMVKDGKAVMQGELEDIRAKYGKSMTDMYREIYGIGGGLSEEIWRK